MASPAPFSFRALVRQIVRERGVTGDGQAVSAAVREIDLRIPAGMHRSAYMEALAAFVREVIREEKERSWRMPVAPPQVSGDVRAPRIPQAPSSDAGRPVPERLTLIRDPVAEEAVPQVADGDGGAEDVVPKGAEILIPDAVILEDARPAQRGEPVVVPLKAPAERCEVTELLVQSCAHCTGRDGLLADDESLCAEVQEKIEAGISREQAVEQVVASWHIPDGPVRHAVRAWLLDRASKIERRIAREVERAALERGGSFTSLERAAAAIRLAETTFKLPGGERILWADATTAQHNARISWMRAQAEGNIADAEFHKRAVRLMDEYGVGRLRDIPDWETKLGAPPENASGEEAA